MGFSDLIRAFSGSHVRVAAVEPFRYFMISADEAAMRWISQNTPMDAVFAINTCPWNGYYHGMDGGYCIPYFTGRFTTWGSMMYPHGTPQNVERINNLSTLIKDLEKDPFAVRPLYAQGVRYIYLGAITLLSTSRLIPQSVEAIPGVQRVYDQQNVQIYEICGS